MTEERVIHYLSEYPGVTQTFVLPLLRKATRYVPEVWAGRASGHSAVSGDWQVRYLGVGRTGMGRWWERLAGRVHGYELREQFRFAKALDKTTPPIAVFAHFGPQGVGAAPACRRMGVPLLTTFYGFDLGIARHPSWGRRYRRLWRDGSAFLVEGPAMADHLARLGAPRDKIHLQRLPVIVDDIPFQPRRWCAGDTLRLVQVARFVEKKGVDLTLRAFARLRIPEPGAELVLVGDGPLAGDLKALARAEGVADRVRFTGMVSHAEAGRILSESHLLVQPSRRAADGDTEGGAPYVLLEAQASGMCVVASRHADIPFVTAPEACFAFSEDDLDGLIAALDEAVASHESWARRAEAGRKFVESHHAAEPLVRRIEALIDDVRGVP